MSGPPSVCWPAAGSGAWSGSAAKTGLTTEFTPSTAIILNCLIKGWFASEAGRQLAEERQQGALELLLSTPLTVRDILRGQLLALKRQFLGPVLAVLALFLVFMFATLADTTAPDDRVSCISTYLAAMLMLVVDLAGLYWIGMWQGLTSKNPNRATSAVVARILVLPWVVYALVLLVVALTWSNRAQEPALEQFSLACGSGWAWPRTLVSASGPGSSC